MNKGKCRYIPSRELTYPIFKGTFEDDFPFPKVGYVNSLEGIPIPWSIWEGKVVCFFFSRQNGLGPWIDWGGKPSSKRACLDVPGSWYKVRISGL